MSCVIVYGEVTETKPGYARVKFPQYDDIVSDWLPVVKMRAMNDDVNWPLEVNEQVACMMSFTDDDRGDTGVILGAINNDADVPDADAGLKKLRLKFSDGASFEYDKDGHVMQLLMEDGGKAEYDGKWKIQAADNEIQLQGSAHNLVKHTPLDTALQTFKTALTVELGLIAAGIAAGGGSYTPGMLTIDISAAKVDELKCP